MFNNIEPLAPGFDQFHEYAKNTSPDAYDGEKVKRLIEEFAGPLTLASDNVSPTFSVYFDCLATNFSISIESVRSSLALLTEASKTVSTTSQLYPFLCRISSTTCTLGGIMARGGCTWQWSLRH
jgi:hypothetical protein